MGVNIFLLDRRPARLDVGGVVQSVGTLRRFWKMTELDEERADELRASEDAAAVRPSPKAAIVADLVELPLDMQAGSEVRAHLVIGWDEGRTRVTDMKWDYLPVLGYAVRNPNNGTFVLHEERDGVLHPLDRKRALELGLTGPDGNLVAHGQPVVTACENVRPFLDRYADADCTLSSGIRETLMTTVEGEGLPPAGWFIGKRPMDVTHYRLGQPPAP